MRSIMKSNYILTIKGKKLKDEFKKWAYVRFYNENSHSYTM